MSGLGFSVEHELGQRLDVRVGDVLIASYVYEPDFPEVESRKPYLHPLRTLDGALISAFRPWDHPWHKGIEMTSSVLSGQNFWGGKTYRDGEGYLWLDNVGRMQHERFETVEASADEVIVRETLSWITAAGERWIDEERTLRFHGADAKELGSGSWTSRPNCAMCAGKSSRWAARRPLDGRTLGTPGCFGGALARGRAARSLPPTVGAAKR